MEDALILVGRGYHFVERFTADGVEYHEALVAGSHEYFAVSRPGNRSDFIRHPPARRAEPGECVSRQWIVGVDGRRRLLGERQGAREHKAMQGSHDRAPT